MGQATISQHKIKREKKKKKKKKKATAPSMACFQAFIQVTPFDCEFESGATTSRTPWVRSNRRARLQHSYRIL